MVVPYFFRLSHQAATAKKATVAKPRLSLLCQWRLAKP
jgi:hypothetical protein